MKISDLTKATLLLRTKFKEESDSVILKPKEFRELKDFLAYKDLEIDCLINEDPSNLLLSLEKETGLQKNRLMSLLGSGVALAVALEKWSSLGIWVLSIFDKDYPLLFKERYRDKCPLLLFGCGDQSLLQAGGLGIVGPRNASKEALNYANKSSKRAAE